MSFHPFPLAWDQGETNFLGLPESNNFIVNIDPPCTSISFISMQRDL
jgi:hypothetical protein